MFLSPGCSYNMAKLKKKFSTDKKKFTERYESDYNEMICYTGNNVDLAPPPPQTAYSVTGACNTADKLLGKLCIADRIVNRANLHSDLTVKSVQGLFNNPLNLQKAPKYPKKRLAPQSFGDIQVSFFFLR